VLGQRIGHYFIHVHANAPHCPLLNCEEVELLRSLERFRLDWLQPR
jgi:hypothetical protein